MSVPLSVALLGKWQLPALSKAGRYMAPGSGFHTHTHSLSVTHSLTSVKLDNDRGTLHVSLKVNFSL